MAHGVSVPAEQWMGECSEGMFAILWLRERPLPDVTKNKRQTDSIHQRYAMISIPCV